MIKSNTINRSIIIKCFFIFGVFLFVQGIVSYSHSFSIKSDHSVIFEKYLKGKGVKGGVSGEGAVDENDIVFENDELLLPTTPKSRSNELNILILGIRGADDPNGGLLTDTILIGSVNTENKISRVVTIPRDIFVYIPGHNKREKVNAVYQYGYDQGGVQEGLAFSKEFFSRLTGIKIQKVAVIDFYAFFGVIDALGGIDITLEQDFTESQQWGCNEYGRNCQIFTLPKGTNHLDSHLALQYGRSRFSSSDFDRQRRVMQIIEAVVARARATGFSDMGAMIKLYETVTTHVKTDIGITDIRSYYGLFGESFDSTRLRRSALLPDGESILEERINGQYVLLPVKKQFDILRASVFKPLK